MKQLRSISIIAVVAALAASLPLAAGSAVAAPGTTTPTIRTSSYTAPAGSVSAEIHITAIVLPKRTVIINEAGEILEIASNTEQDIAPVVYLGTPGVNTQRTLTAELYTAYRQHVPEGTAQAGILYQRTNNLGGMIPTASIDTFTRE